MNHAIAAALPQSSQPSAAVGEDALRIDNWILIPALTLLAIGILMVFSTTAVSNEQANGDGMRMIRHHFAHIVLGSAAFMICLSIPPRKLYDWAVPMLLVSIVLLALTLIPGIGHVAGGARRWLVIGPVRLQPGEMAKICSIIYFASYIERQHEKMYSIVSGMLLPFMVLCVVSVLLLREPDFGSTVIILSVVFCQLFLFCRLGHLMISGSAVAVGLLMLVYFSPYRMKRFTAFMDPFQAASSSGYQLIQSLIAVGSGGFLGTGLGSGRQKLYYLPAAHTDFIYAVIAEELGMAGALFVLGLFLIILYRGVKVSRRLLARPYLSSLALGCTMLIVLPALLNMGVVLGMLPTKGMVLPLVAYGGTAMVVHMAVLGLLLRLSKTRA